MEDEWAEDMTFQAAQSRAIRNVVLAGVPRWLTDQAKERAKEAVLQGINKDGLAAATEKALKFLAGYGITGALPFSHRFKDGCQGRGNIPNALRLG